MHIQTFSIVVGGVACNAKCPFCVASLTPAVEFNDSAVLNIHVRNFRKAANLAKTAGATTVMLTGKGEPTLYRKQISQYLSMLQEWNFPRIELQTNAILLESRIPDEELALWYDMGLDTIAISTAGFDSEINRQIYMPYADNYIDLAKVIARLHRIGFTVRVNCLLFKQGVSSVAGVSGFIQKAKQLNVDQTTIVPINKPGSSLNSKMMAWVGDNQLDPDTIADISNYLQVHGTLLHTLTGGSQVFDVNGQNVCWATCLTKDAYQQELRNIIYYGTGRVTTSWEFEGGVLLA